VAADAGWLLGFVLLFGFLAAAWVVVVGRAANAIVARISRSDPAPSGHTVA